MSKKISQKLRIELNSSDADTRIQALKEIVHLQRKDALLTVSVCLHDTNKFVRSAALELLVELTGVAYSSEIIDILGDPSEFVRHRAVQTLQKLDVFQLEVLLSEKSHPNFFVRANLAKLLEDKQSEAVYSTLITLLQDQNEFVRQSAAKSLGGCGYTEAVPHLIKLLDDQSPVVRYLSARSLGQLRDLRALNPLLNTLENETHLLVRIGIIYGLGGMIDERAAQALLSVAFDPKENLNVQTTVVTALAIMDKFGEITLKQIAAEAPQSAVRADARNALNI